MLPHKNIIFICVSVLFILLVLYVTINYMESVQRLDEMGNIITQKEINRSQTKTYP